MALRSWSVLFAALMALLLSLLLAPPRAAAQDPARFDVLVFSKTTGFRHESAIAAGRTGIQAIGAAGTTPSPLRGRRRVLRRRAARLRGRRLPAHRRRGHPQRRAADRVRALDVARRRHRLDPRRRERRPQLGLEDRHDGRRAVRQPPRRRAPVPERDGPGRGPGSPRYAGDSRRVGAQRRVVQLHRRAARQGPRPRHARREHLRGAGRHRPRPTTTRSPGARTTTAAATSTPRSATRARTGRSRSTARTSPARSSGRPARPPGDCGAPREGLPTDASFDKVTLDDTTENPMEIAVAPDGTVYTVELAGQIKRYDPANGSVASSARSPCTAATRTACSASRSTRTSRRTAGSTSSTARRRPRSSTSRASRSAATARST